MNILNYVKKHKAIVGVLLFALCFTCFSSHLTFADERLLIGSFNSSDEPVQLVVANVNSPMYSVLATAANQTVSSHSDDNSYAFLSGQTFLDYIGYCGLYDILSYSAKWFYDNSVFCNYCGYYDNGTVLLTFIFGKSNCVSQPLEWVEETSSGLSFSVLEHDSLYLCPSLQRGWFCFYPYNGFFLPNTQTSVDSSLPTINTSNDSGSLQIFVSSPILGNKSFPIIRDTSSSLDKSTLFNTFVDNDSYKYLYFTYTFSLDNFNNDVAPTFKYSINYVQSSATLRCLASSFYTYSFDSSEYRILTSYSYSWRTQQFGKIVNDSYVYNTFPFIPNSGALAYESEFNVNPTATPTPFPTYEPWDPNNPAGGSTPTPIPSGFGGITPTPIPSVSPPPATVTPINIFYNPVIDNGSDIWGTVKSIFDDFNGFFLGNEFIKFCSSLMNNVFYFDTHFMYFVIPVYICFIMFLIGRFRRK